MPTDDEQKTRQRQENERVRSAYGPGAHWQPQSDEQKTVSQQIEALTIRLGALMQRPVKPSDVFEWRDLAREYAILLADLEEQKTVSQHVDGPNKREMSSVLAQLRHLYMLLGEGGKPEVYQRLLSRQITRLESLDRVLFQPLPSPPQEPETK